MKLLDCVAALLVLFGILCVEGAPLVTIACLLVALVTQRLQRWHSHRVQERKARARQHRLQYEVAGRAPTTETINFISMK